MKKLIRIIFLSVVTLASVTSCQKDEVKPSSELNGGGHASDPIK